MSLVYWCGVRHVNGQTNIAKVTVPESHGSLADIAYCRGLIQESIGPSTAKTILVVVPGGKDGHARS